MTEALVKSTYLPPPDRNEFESMISMANSLAKAQGFLPAHFFGQPYKILAAILYGRDLGISATNALQHIIVIEGKATADAQLIGMLVRRAGHQMVDETTDTASTVTITRSDGTVHEATFTMQDAQRAGLVRVGGAWTKYPAAMLYARALTACARKGAQDALMGTVYVPEEMGLETDADGTVIMPPSLPTGEIPFAEASPEAQKILEATPEPVENSSEPEIETSVAQPQNEEIEPPRPSQPLNGKRRGRPLGSKNHTKAEAVDSVAAAAAPAFGDAIEIFPVTIADDPEVALRKQIHDLASRLRKYQYQEKGVALPPSDLWAKEVDRTLGTYIERTFGTGVALDDLEVPSLRQAIEDIKHRLTTYETVEQPPVEEPPTPDTTVVSLHKPLGRNLIAAPRRERPEEPTPMDAKATLERVRLQADLTNRTIALLAGQEGLTTLTAKDEIRLREKAAGTVDRIAHNSFSRPLSELNTVEIGTLIDRAKAAAKND